MPDAAEAERERIRAAAREAEGRHTRNFFVSSQRGGRALSALMLPLFAIRPPAGYALLTTTGRRSGKPRRKCVRAYRDGSTAYLVMLRPPVVAVERPGIVSAWVHNIRADPRVRLRIGFRTFEGRARELDDPGELGRAREGFGEMVVPFDFGECMSHMRGLPSRDKILEMNRYWFATGIPLAVDLAG